MITGAVSFRILFVISPPVDFLAGSVRSFRKISSSVILGRSNSWSGVENEGVRRAAARSKLGFGENCLTNVSASFSALLALRWASHSRRLASVS